MRPLILSCVFLSAAALAEMEADRRYELGLTGGLGYSSFNGIIYGLGVNLGVKLDQRWQWTLGTDSTGSKNHTRQGASTGLRYNFSEDWSRAFYLEGGVAYDHFRYSKDYDKDYDGGRFGTYMTVGKRVPLNKSGSWTWNPEATVYSNSMKSATIGLNPVNFSYSF